MQHHGALRRGAVAQPAAARGARAAAAPGPRRPARAAARVHHLHRAPRTSLRTASTAEPTISVTFVDKEGGNTEFDCPSGEQLRAVMMENKVDLYTTWGKIWSCGGVGQCGTCIVKVDAGMELLSERTATEDKKLKGKPDAWRLACQTIVGDGDNTGKVVISTKPQQ
ncbi:MAG: 2Fe-2S ferredoxin-type domain-containing protein [Monoraphidium minutum]|nr:MAG: 2Fe-2S ferredoxin-type domain-containing protein [Monoraphidium minutum]